MSCLDCACLRRSQVISISLDKDSSSSISSNWVKELPRSWIPPTIGDHEMPVRSSDASTYELQQELGKGFWNLSTVYLARHSPTGTLVTVRITDLENCTDEHLKTLQNELAMSSFFRHPNIVASWKIFTAGSWLWIVSPFMAYRSASSLIKNYYPEGMNEVLIGTILYGVLKGLDYLHQNGYIHRNLKASHILISEDGLVSLSGLSHLYCLIQCGEKMKVAHDFPNFSTAMLPWFSPELLRQDLYGYNVKSDIYSLGITACELATGRVPFMDMHRTQMLLQKLKGLPHIPLFDTGFSCEESPIKNSRSGMDSGIGESVVAANLTQTMTSERLRTPSPKRFSSDLQNFVELCLQQDPEKRPSAHSLLSHAFFKPVRELTQGSVISLLPSLEKHRRQRSTVPCITNWNKSMHNSEDKEWTFD
ncbi:hypothetical protein GDO86_017077 [Hymenochirus boettgeri]|uniref:Protein kinase domain-containing protein n=1 Tax=Hymenochirus boettgeri TaxID=247094 RepID=A0A8T2IIC4_9PIPI|nr:hypothetical protein GDO86_017077 [Hymenochirus boettgeri]KAG8432695.1 hypothetical protein GDO86_017077 [Hymenochirus boettgeri]